MKQIMNKSKIASLVLLASMSSAPFANELAEQTSAESNESTYWGLGIGSVLGGIIAGPPGIAIGASLGGAFGWGQDQHEALEEAQEQLHEQANLVTSSSNDLNTEMEKLRATRAKLGELKRRHHHQTEKLNDLQAELASKVQTLEQSDLSNLLSAYTQEIYFEKGQARVPSYVSDRISSMAEFLQRYPHLQITLTGFSDQSGPAIFNQELSQARAQGVKDALLAQGISAERIVIKSVGESMAHVAEGDEGNAILDRRVAIEFGQDSPQEIISTKEEPTEPSQVIESTSLAELSQ